ISLHDAPVELAALKPSAIVDGSADSVPKTLRESRTRLGLYRPDGAVAQALRIHPLTGDAVTKIFTRANGCGFIYSSAYLQFMRSGTLGLYDMLDDSGIRNFGGIRPSCGQNMMAS